MRGAATRVRQHVLGQRHHDGAGAARKGGRPGAGHDLGDAVGAVDLHRPLRDGAEEGRVVDFLERLAPLHVGADLAHEHDHGGGVLAGRVDADGGVGGTGAAGDETEAGLSGELAVGFRHEGRAAFVAGVHELEAGRVMHRVE
jgi:hypothetical protein